MLTRKFGYMVIGGLLALGIVFGGAAVFAQIDGSEADPTEETPAETEDATPSDVESDTDSDLTGPHGRGFSYYGGDRDEALAEALGITIDELDAAQEEAFSALVAQAVADGTLTQEQADELLAAETDGSPYFGGFGHGSWSSTHQQYLADALGISLEELQSAYDEVMAAQLAAMVEAGALTQEEADMIAARDAVKDRIDDDALSAAAQESYEAAVAQALADGEITQEQADTLLSESADFGFFGRGFGDRGGHGHHRGHGRGGGMFGPGIFENAEPAVEGVDA